MIKVSILKQGQITNAGEFASQEEANAWLSKHEGLGSFGQKAQDIEQQIEVTGAVLDEQGNEISPAKYETQIVHIEGYSVLIEDKSAELAQQAINAEALAFLAATDWIVVRSIERGEQLSPEFKAERQAARDRIVK